MWTGSESSDCAFDCLVLSVGCVGMGEKVEEEEEGWGWCGEGDTSILATSSTMLLDDMCMMALDELLLELEPRRGPDEVEE